MTESAKDHWLNAMVIQADFHEFSPAETYHYPQVQSCYISYCLSGKGIVRINNKDFNYTPGTILFAPWNHSITYMPAPSDPYISCGVHIIPDCEDHGDTVFNAFHTIQSDHPLYWKRHNEPLPGFNRAGCFHRPLYSHIIHLIDYACDCYIARAGERKLRLLAQLLFHEIYDLVNPEPGTAGNYPEPFLRILQRIEDNLEMPLTLKELVRNGKYSISGLNRLFNKYMNTSPQRYIARRRMHHAAMVLRKSSKSIAALAQSLQFSTEGNFSRAFSREFGVPPRQYRQNPPQTSYAPDIYRPPTQKNSGMKTLFVPKFIPDSINPATGEEK